MTTPRADTTTNPHCQPPWSMANPATGAPDGRAGSHRRAVPAHHLAAEPFGTWRLSCSTVAVIVGAQRKPDTVMSTAKLGTPTARATGRGGGGKAAEQPEDREGRCQAP